MSKQCVACIPPTPGSFTACKSFLPKATYPMLQRCRAGRVTAHMVMSKAGRQIVQTKTKTQPMALVPCKLQLVVLNGNLDGPKCTGDMEAVCPLEILN